MAEAAQKNRTPAWLKFALIFIAVAFLSMALLAGGLLYLLLYVDWHHLRALYGGWAAIFVATVAVLIARPRILSG